MAFTIFSRIFCRGRLVGEDSQGNQYYEGKKIVRYGKPRRWVRYKGRAEATKVPPEWHGWLHYTTANPPMPRQAYSWEKEHLPNLTGTVDAYKPKGLGGVDFDKGYEAWKPE